jgi:hypothetical protein
VTVFGICPIPACTNPNASADAVCFMVTVFEIEMWAEIG